MQKSNQAKVLVSLAHREYLVHYSNGFKQHVSAVELAGIANVRQIGPREYQAPSLCVEQADGPSYLAGNFIWQIGSKREWERMQTPIGQIKHLQAMGWQG